MCEFNFDLWQYRNDEVHGRTQQEAQQKLREVVEAKVTALYARDPILLARYPSVHSVPLAVRLAKPTLLLQMWIKQVLQQERLTDIARQKAQMEMGSIDKFLKPRVMRRRRYQVATDQLQAQGPAISTIVWWWRRSARCMSRVELPRMGIGDPG